MAKVFVTASLLSPKTKWPVSLKQDAPLWRAWRIWLTYSTWNWQSQKQKVIGCIPSPPESTMGYPVSLKHKWKLVNICPLISYTIFTLFCTNVYQSSGGTFAERKYETLNPPKSQKFNSFMVTKQSQMERAVYSRFIAHALFQLLLFTIWLQNYISTHMRIWIRQYCRTISCTCNACIVGKLEGCLNAPFVPAWEHSVVSFRPCTPIIGITDNEVEIWNKLNALENEKETLPFYCCLGWVGGVQHPTVLYIKHLRLNQRTVRCHVLLPHKPVLNDFGWTLVQRPNQLCNKLDSDCSCNLQHAQNFPVKHILSIAVKQLPDRRHRSLFAVSRTETPPPNHQLIYLPMTKEGDDTFECFAKKRVEYFNDLYLRVLDVNL